MASNRRAYNGPKPTPERVWCAGCGRLLGPDDLHGPKPQKAPEEL